MGCVGVVWNRMPLSKYPVSLALLPFAPPSCRMAGEMRMSDLLFDMFPPLPNCCCTFDTEFWQLTTCPI